MVPARAGVILGKGDLLLQALGGSRASGGDPEVFLVVKPEDLWFPRERG